MEDAKQVVALAAAALVEDGMRVGLGSGSTMRLAILAIAARGLRIVGVPTSEDSAALARAHGIALGEADGTPLDLAIDGADEVERGTLRLVKGLGGALLREKIVREQARRFVVVADPSKVVDALGSKAPLPVEVARFGHAATAARIAALGGAPVLRGGAAPFVTDGGNVIYDCPGFAPIADPLSLQLRLRGIAGVMETGLFLERPEQVLIGRPDGTTEVLR